MDQQLLMKAQFLQKQSEEIEQNLQLIDHEIEDLESYDKNLEALSKSNEDSIMAAMGKGIHMKAKLESKELFVEVGAGIVVKKTPEEARKVIESQMKKLAEARVHLYGKLEIYHQTLQNMIMDIQNSQGNSKEAESEELEPAPKKGKK